MLVTASSCQGHQMQRTQADGGRDFRKRKQKIGRRWWSGIGSVPPRVRIAAKWVKLRVRWFCTESTTSELSPATAPLQQPKGQAREAATYHHSKSAQQTFQCKLTMCRLPSTWRLQGRLAQSVAPGIPRIFPLAASQVVTTMRHDCHTSGWQTV